MLEELVYTALWMGLFASLDHLIRCLKYEKPYYAVHALHNALIVYATGSDLVHTFTDLYNLQTYATNWFAIQLCFALHLYHCALYWKSFRFDDWLRHGLMIGVALPIGCIPEAHTFTGMSLFFTTGLPGGIDYALLFAVRNGWVNRHTEKRINAFLNVWIRSPGCMAMAALSIACNLSQPSVYCITLLPSLLNYWNGQYFMQQVLTDSVMKLN